MFLKGNLLHEGLVNSSFSCSKINLAVKQLHFEVQPSSRWSLVGLILKCKSFIGNIVSTSIISECFGVYYSINS